MVSDMQVDGSVTFIASSLHIHFSHVTCNSPCVNETNPGVINYVKFETILNLQTF